jgi:hypothetical protein
MFNVELYDSSLQSCFDSVEYFVFYLLWFKHALNACIFRVSLAELFLITKVRMYVNFSLENFLFKNEIECNKNLKLYVPRYILRP